MMSPATCTSPTGPSSRPAPLAAGSPVYLDLAYLPGGGAGHLDQNFFLRVRALCYVISGQGQRQEEGLRGVLDALLAGKRQWDLDLQVGGPQDSEISLLRGVSAQPKDAAWGLGALSCKQFWGTGGVHAAEECHQSCVWPGPGGGGPLVERHIAG